MAGVNLGDVQIFLRQGTPAPQGCSLYFVIGAADELCEFQRARGVEIVEPVGDRPWGFRDFTPSRDLHGYHLSLRATPLQRWPTAPDRAGGRSFTPGAPAGRGAAGSRRVQAG